MQFRNVIAAAAAASVSLLIAILTASVAIAGAASLPVASGQGDTEAHGLYGSKCASCHGATLAGGAGPSLKGVAFTAKWMGQSAIGLYRVIAEQMPQGQPGSLSSEQAQTLTALLLDENDLAPAPGGILASRHGPAVAETADTTVYPRPPASVTLPSTSLPSQAELLAPSDSDWLMYNRDYRGQRFSRLARITMANADRLTPRCIFQTGEVGSFQSSPIAYRGRLYFTTPYNSYAIDGSTCRKLWEHSHARTGAEGNANNRGPALYEGRLIRGTPDGHLIALDAATGAELWNTKVVDSGGRYALSAAITAYDGKVFTGVAGGDRGGIGRIFAFDAATGRHLWTFKSIPTGDEPGAETWGGGAKLGGGGSWTTISFDPETKLLLAPIGNPGSDLDGRDRPGSNLYTNSVVALDPQTGKLAWYVQQVAHDLHDWNTAAAPMLYTVGGQRYMAVATKGGWLFTYNHDGSRLLSKHEISSHLNETVEPGDIPVRICPGTLGGAEWNGPAFDSRNDQVLVNSVDWCGTFKRQQPDRPNTFGGTVVFDPVTEAKGWLRAFDAVSGKPRWTYASGSPMVAGVTPTAGRVVFTGSSGGDFLVFDSRTGKQLYRFNTGGAVAGGVTTYAAAGEQFVAVASGNNSRSIWRTNGAATIIVFGLPTRQGARSAVTGR